MTSLIKDDELSLLKARADRMGLPFHPNIGLAKLKDKVNSALKGNKETVSEAPVLETKARKNQRLRREASALVRVQVTCMNPEKKAYTGEMFTVSNSVVGTIKKYIPFNNDSGWHIPRIILNVMQERKCAIRYIEKNKKGEEINKTKLIPEFNIVILEPLTQIELDELAQQQAISQSLAD